ncbi:hypothetical protein L218DRAFT_981538 [Marasmius fiardii PR-910]|nr:hypothetical protein L218DRAFT_981538 [Marasmius fiardii PR-910]
MEQNTAQAPIGVNKASNGAPTTGQTQYVPKSPEDLPQETLDFAARVFDAARKGDQSVIPVIEAGLPVNLTNHQGNTLLMLSVYAGHISLARDLLAKGADPNRLNDQGQSIIAGAVFKGHHDIVKLLVDNKADVRLGKPNAIESVWMFAKEQGGDGKMSRDELLALMDAKEEDKERLEREGVELDRPLGALGDVRPSRRT